MSKWLLWKRSNTPCLKHVCARHAWALHTYVVWAIGSLLICIRPTFSHIIPLKMPKITEFERHNIITLHQQGHSQRKIRKQTGYSRCGIQAVIKTFEESGEVKDKKRTGRPGKLSKSDEKFLREGYLFVYLVFLGFARAVCLARDFSGYLPFGGSFQTFSRSGWFYLPGFPHLRIECQTRSTYQFISRTLGSAERSLV